MTTDFTRREPPGTFYSRPSEADLVICPCSKPYFLHERKDGHQQFKSTTVFNMRLPFRGVSVVCLHCCCQTAPERGGGFLRSLHCPALFSECKKGCRPGFCTLPRHCIHSALSHCSGPKNLGNQREKEKITSQLIFLVSRQTEEMKKGTEKF